VDSFAGCHGRVMDGVGEGSPACVEDYGKMKPSWRVEGAVIERCGRVVHPFRGSEWLLIQLWRCRARLSYCRICENDHRPGALLSPCSRDHSSPL